MPYRDQNNFERFVYQETPREMSVEHNAFVRYYRQIGLDSPHLDEWTRLLHALQAAHMDGWLAERKRRIGPVRLVRQESGFVNALFGAVETTGRMPAVRKKEEQAG